MIVIIAYENYPDGSAGAIRCESLAQMYVDLGYDVLVCHKGMYTNLGNPQVASFYRENKYIKFFCFSRFIVRKLNLLKQTKKIDAVISYDTIFKPVCRWCIQNNVVHICDIVEWYSKEQFHRWYLSIPYWKKEWDIRYLVKKKFNIIGVSSYLAKFFKDKGCKSVCVPIVGNDTKVCQRTDEDVSVINIIYAGSHLLMDNIPLIVKSLSILREEERRRICMTIFGLSEDAIYAYLSEKEINNTKSILKIKGRKPNSEVVEAYKTAHFTIMLRDPELRVNKAGFPSKVVESMKMGVPMICNYSSDLDKYLVAGENCVNIRDLTQESLCAAFRRILEITPSEMSKLRLNAASTISKHLTPMAFKTQLIEILSK